MDEKVKGANVAFEEGYLEEVFLQKKLNCIVVVISFLLIIVKNFILKFIIVYGV